MKITTQIMGADKKTPIRTLETEYDFGANLAAAVALFGETVVFEHFVDNVTIALQAFARNRMKLEGEKHQMDAVIAAAIATWKPSQRKPADPAKRVETVNKLTANMSAEERKKLIEQLQATLVPANVPTTKKGKHA